MSVTSRAATVVLPAMLAGILSWIMGIDEPPERQVMAAPEPWSLAKTAQPDQKSARDYLASMSMWGNVPLPARDEAQQEPAWRLLAVMSKGKEKYVLLDVEKQPNRQLKIGDELPGGAVIQDIHEDALCVSISGSRRLLPLYQRDGVKL